MTTEYTVQFKGIGKSLNTPRSTSIEILNYSLFIIMAFRIPYSSLVSRGPDSHSPGESGQTPIPILFRRSVLTKQQKRGHRWS